MSSTMYKEHNESLWSIGHECQVTGGWSPRCLASSWYVYLSVPCDPSIGRWPLPDILPAMGTHRRLIARTSIRYCICEGVGRHCKFFDREHVILLYRHTWRIETKRSTSWRHSIPIVFIMSRLPILITKKKCPESIALSKTLPKPSPRNERNKSYLIN